MQLTPVSVSEPTLSAEEARRLTELESTIRSGLAGFMAVGYALMEIAERRLHRAKFPNFNAYCKETWGFGKGRGYKLIECVKVAANLAQCEIQPESDSPLRHLVGISPGDQKAIWDLATENGQQPNRDQMAALVNDLFGAQLFNRKLQLPKQLQQPSVEVTAMATPTNAAASDAEWISEISKIWYRIYFGTLDQFSDANKSDIEDWIWRWCDNRAAERKNHHRAAA
jgi:hypothetical protein